MSSAEEFFYEHAGWSEPPGRRVCAQRLAADEQWFTESMAEFIVEPDPNIETTATDEQLERIHSGETVYLQVALIVGDEVMATLGGIEVTGEDDPYLRVVRAELAAEAREAEAQAFARNDA